MTATINKDDFIPIYYQLSELIKEKVHSGLLKTGEQLQPEDKLACEYDVSRKTVRQALDKLSKEGYVSRQKGKGTFIDSQYNRSKLISLIISDSFFGDYHRSINDLIGGAALEICPSGCEMRLNTYKQIPKLLEECKAGKTDIRGFVFIRYREEMKKYLDLAKKAGLPVILEGAECKNDSFVEIDNESPMKDAVKYLSDLGHKEIGVLSLPYVDAPHYRARTEAGIAAVKEFSGATRDCWVYNFSSIEIVDIKDEAKKILSSKALPTAFISVSDNAAIGLMRAADEMGIAVPEELSIVGFDDVPGVELLLPPLTTFKQDYFLMGKMAAQKLIEMLDNYKYKKQQLKVKPEFIIRGSCASPKGKRNK